MDKARLPYSILAGLAAAADNDDAVNEVVQRCLQDVANRLMKEVVCKYDHIDLPLVLAAIKVSASGLENLLSEEDKLMEKIIIEQTENIVVDMSAVKQKKKGGDSNGCN